MISVFVDRDGVLNKRVVKGYVKKVSEFEWCPLALASLHLLNQFMCKIFIVTNQAGVGKGIMTLLDLHHIHEKLLQDVNQAGAKIEHIYFCTHTKEENCNCRKPNAGLFIKAAKEYHLDLTKSILIGDSLTDIQAGKKVGCKTILVESCTKGMVNELEEKHLSIEPDWFEPNIWGAAVRVIRVIQNH